MIDNLQLPLPRLSFEITGLSYDGERKLTRIQKYKTVKSKCRW